MPELPDEVGKAFLDLVLTVAFAGGGPTNFQAAAFTRNFVRIIDKAAAEYRLARVELVEHVNTPNNHMSPLFRAIGHLENCVSAIRRAHRFAHHKNGPKLPKAYVLSGAIEKRVIRMRDAIEHADERIRKGSVKEGDFLMLAVKEDGIELEGNEILYSELAEWLIQLHSLAQYVATYQEKPRSAL